MAKSIKKHSDEKEDKALFNKLFKAKTIKLAQQSKIKAKGAKK